MGERALIPESFGLGFNAAGCQNAHGVTLRCDQLNNGLGVSEREPVFLQYPFVTLPTPKIKIKSNKNTQNTNTKHTQQTEDSAKKCPEKIAGLPRPSPNTRVRGAFVASSKQQTAQRQTRRLALAPLGPTHRHREGQREVRASSAGGGARGA